MICGRLLTKGHWGRFPDWLFRNAVAILSPHHKQPPMAFPMHKRARWLCFSPNLQALLPYGAGLTHTERAFLPPLSSNTRVLLLFQNRAWRPTLTPQHQPTPRASPEPAAAPHCSSHPNSCFWDHLLMWASTITACSFGTELSVAVHISQDKFTLWS